MSLRLAILAGVVALAAALGPRPLLAVEPSEILSDPALEARARELSRGIRCLVCQNESIDSSNADLAKELRLIVRERLVAGDSDRAVLDYLVSKYGDYVLLEPPFKASTYLLWFGPLVLLVLGGGLVLVYFSGPRLVPVAKPLSAEEQARVSRILEREDRGGADPGRDGPETRA